MICKQFYCILSCAVFLLNISLVFCPSKTLSMAIKFMQKVFFCCGLDILSSICIPMGTRNKENLPRKTSKQVCCLSKFFLYLRPLKCDSV